MTWGYRALSTAWSLLRCRIEGVAGCGSIVRERGCSQGTGVEADLHGRDGSAVPGVKKGLAGDMGTKHVGVTHLRHERETVINHGAISDVQHRLQWRGI
jgi:hypothetical protein